MRGLEKYYAAYIRKWRAAEGSRVFNRALAFQILAGLVSLLVLVLAARWLRPDAFGRYSTLLAYVEIGLVPISLGLDRGAIGIVDRYVTAHEYGAARAFYGFGIRVVLLVGLLLLLGGLIASRSLVEMPLAYFLLGLSLVIVLGLKEFNLQVLRSLFAMGKAYGPSLLLSGLLLCGYYVLNVTSHNDLVAYLLIYNAVGAIVIVLQFHLIGRTLQHATQTPSALIRQWLGISIPMMLISGSAVFLARIDVLAVNRVLGDHQTGIYSLALTVNRLLTFFLVAVNSLLFPSILHEIQAHNRRKAQQLIKLFVLIGGALACAAFVAFAVAGPAVLSLVGRSYSEVYVPAIILLLGSLINVLTGPVGNLLIYTGYDRLCLLTYAALSLVSMVTYPLAARLYGLVGVAVAVACTTITVNLFFVWAVKRYLGLNSFVYLIMKQSQARGHE